MNFENFASDAFALVALKLMSKASIFPAIGAGSWQEKSCFQQNFSGQEPNSLSTACLPRPADCFALSRQNSSRALTRQQFSAPIGKELEGKQSVLTDPPQAGPEAAMLKPSGESKSAREPLRVLIIGPRQGVISTIHTLYLLGFAEVGEWSPLIPGPNPGEVMSILTRSFPTE